MKSGVTYTRTQTNSILRFILKSHHVNLNTPNIYREFRSDAKEAAVTELKNILMSIDWRKMKILRKKNKDNKEAYAEEEEEEEKAEDEETWIEDEKLITGFQKYLRISSPNKKEAKALKKQLRDLQRANEEKKSAIINKHIEAHITTFNSKEKYVGRKINAHTWFFVLQDLIEGTPLLNSKSIPAQAARKVLFFEFKKAFNYLSAAKENELASVKEDLTTNILLQFIGQLCCNNQSSSAEIIHNILHSRALAIKHVYKDEGSSSSSKDKKEIRDDRLKLREFHAKALCSHLLMALGFTGQLSSDIKDEFIFFSNMIEIFLKADEFYEPFSTKDYHGYCQPEALYKGALEEIQRKTNEEIFNVAHLKQLEIELESQTTTGLVVDNPEPHKKGGLFNLLKIGSNSKRKLRGGSTSPTSLSPKGTSSTTPKSEPTTPRSSPPTEYELAKAQKQEPKKKKSEQTKHKKHPITPAFTHSKKKSHKRNSAEFPTLPIELMPPTASQSFNIFPQSILPDNSSGKVSFAPEGSSSNNTSARTLSGPLSTSAGSIEEMRERSKKTHHGKSHKG